MNLRSIPRHLRLTPFNTDTEGGRAAERYRRALWTMLANGVSRGLGLLVVVFTVRWTMPYLGAERFGAWMTVASFATLLSFLDLGMGNALTNRVAQADGSGNATGLVRTISGGLGMLAVLALALVLVLVPLAALAPWARLPGVSTAALADEVGTAARVFAALFAVTIFSNGVTRIFHGLQRGFEAHAAAALGAVLTLLGLWQATRAQAGLPILLACVMSPSILVNLALSTLLLARRQWVLRGCADATRHERPHLLRVGGLFLVLQVGAMVGWGADSLIIASTGGVASVAAYTIAQRLGQFVTQPLAVLNAPLWPAYAEAAIRHDHAFNRRTFVRSLSVTAAVALSGAVVVAMFGRELASLWTHAQLDVPPPLLWAMAVWLVLEACGNALAMLLNGLGIVREQVWVVLAFVTLALPLKLLLALHWGAAGVVGGSAAAYLLTVGLGYGVVFRHNIRASL